MTAIASRSQLRMVYLRYALVTVPLVLLLGLVSSRISDPGYGNRWFAALQKPEAMPSASLFPVAWILLYILLGLAVALILHARGARGRGVAISLFVLQLLLNYAWSPLFFALHEVRAALVVIVAMLVTAAVTTILFAPIRKAAALMMLPYLAWLGFALWLNFQIMVLNPNAESLVPVAGSANISL
ncbi:MAG: tryptophan-rich sensory protein [Alphaproteobacteria bacterium]|nr:tryptophan-rich sensory protein [Alphaproteobacteria bacterium]